MVRHMALINLCVSCSAQPAAFDTQKHTALPCSHLTRKNTQHYLAARHTQTRAHPTHTHTRTHTHTYAHTRARTHTGTHTHTHARTHTHAHMHTQIHRHALQTG